MKKLIRFLVLCTCLFSLSSCQGNWFGQTIEIPWYFIAIPLALVLVISYVILINITFVCPDCQTEFKPKWYHLFVGIHYMGKRIAKCPKCGRKGFCQKKK